MADDAARWVMAAQALGADATAWFAIGLFGVLALAGLLWRLHPPVRTLLGRHAGRRPGSVLALGLGSGFVAIAGAAALVAGLADAVGANGVLGRADEALTAALARAVAPTTLRAFATITHLGDPALLTALCGVVAAWLWWRGRRWLAAGWCAALAGNAVLNPTLKLLFARARPVHSHGLVSEHGYSFPSGHSSGAVVAWGMLAYVLLRLLPPRWHLAVLLSAVTLVYSIGCSRVFLQVHYASDVAAGFASGTAWLTVCIVTIEALRRRGRTPGSAALG